METANANWDTLIEREEMENSTKSQKDIMLISSR